MISDPKQLPYLLELLDDETPLVRNAVIRELATFGSSLYDELKSLPIEITPKDKLILNKILEVPRRFFLKRQWPYWFGLADDRERLESALTFLAEYQSGLEFQGQLKAMLDAIADEYRSKYMSNDAHTLAEFLFKTKSFSGAQDDYYNPHNSNLIYVIKQRKGIPISLSCVYMLVGWRLGLNIRGCNSPRHFLTIVENGSRKELIDCFHAGKVIGEKEIATISRETSLSLDDALKLEADAMGIIRRVLGNLIFAYQQVERDKDSYLMVHLLKEVQLFQDQRDHDLSGIEGLEDAAPYPIGLTVVHADEGYRGIIVDYDLYCVSEKFSTDDEQRSDYNQPWYQILVHQSDKSVYVPHSELLRDSFDGIIQNPLIGQFFTKTEDGSYLRNHLPWIE